MAKSTSATAGDLSIEWPPVSLSRLTRAVVVGQMLFTAGHALTTGGFFYEFSPSATSLALFLVVPETVAAASLLARPLLRLTRQRKRLWILATLAARFFAAGVPLVVWLDVSRIHVSPLSWLLAALVATEALQSIAYVAYLSWLSDLVPAFDWGRFFAKRLMAMLAISLVVPTVAAFLQQAWRTQLLADERLITYVVAFALGNLLIVLSLVPLLRLPDVQGTIAVSIPTLARMRDAFADRAFRLLLLHSWWLSFFQGLTQAAFFRVRIDLLDVSLANYYVLLCTMNAVQIPLTWWGGRVSDRRGDKRLLFGSVIAVSFAMPFWLIAERTGEWTWLFGAYVLWGLFGAVNIAGRNFALGLAPRSDNAVHLSLFRQVSGLFAASAGFLGGVWVERLQAVGSVEVFGYAVGTFGAIFTVSWIGRATAGLWLLPIAEPTRAGRG